MANEFGFENRECRMVVADNDCGAAAALFADLMAKQAEAVRQLFSQVADRLSDAPAAESDGWANSVQQLRSLWLDFLNRQAAQLAEGQGLAGELVAVWPHFVRNLLGLMPLLSRERLQGLSRDCVSQWQEIFGDGGTARADPAWRELPFFALFHQTCLMLAAQLTALVDTAEGLEPGSRELLRFMAGKLAQALSPANFETALPDGLNRALETRGASLVKGLEHLIADLERGQITHSDPVPFRLGETIAATPARRCTSPRSAS